MQLNTLELNRLQPTPNSKKSKMRVGRGIGCGKGKTCGCGHKGQTARSGYSKKIGFEGGQMPLHRRIPKFGFISLAAKEQVEIKLSQLNKLAITNITLDELKKIKLVPCSVKRAKVILSGTIDKAINLSGILVTAGARKAILAVGGKIED